MFGNVLNHHDLRFFLRKLREKGFRRAFARLRQNVGSKVAESWRHTQGPVGYYDIPAIQQRRNQLVSGNPAVDHRTYFARKYFSSARLDALSLGCGTGSVEVAWAKTGKFRRIDAYDVAEPRIRYARELATQSSVDHIVNFHVGDVYSIPQEKDRYSVIITENSLHHFSPLEDILLRIRRLLTPSGYYIVSEFVGPTRFQWTQRQLNTINALLIALPLKYRVQQSDHRVKSYCYRPGTLAMRLSDPSEAVESGRIVPLLEKHFQSIEVKPVGETILQMLLNDIAWNFMPDADADEEVEQEKARLLQALFALEDALIRNGDVQNDFIIGIYHA